MAYGGEIMAAMTLTWRSGESVATAAAISIYARAGEERPSATKASMAA